MALCHSCTDVLRDGHTQKIHSTCRSFHAAVDEECHICQGLFSQVPEEWKPDTPWSLTSSSTRSEETFAKLKTWLGRCGKTHDKCRPRRNEADVGWHPTRLIEVASSPTIGDSANHLRCRVVEPQSEDMPQNLRYITLSHRWPRDQQGFQKLTEDNLPLWKARLPVEMLRQTFRDAFFVAHKFGISYVWIDSLCIIQDGDDCADWRKESPMMQKVYSNAEFNICASKSDQNGGLFSSRRPQALQVEISRLGKLDDASVTDGRNYLIRKESPQVIWEARMNDSPLASRGWVFQEQLLSRANLHFGDHEVLFECREMRATESLGSDEDYEESWGRPLPFFKEHLPMPVSSTETSISGADCSDLPRHNFNRTFLWHNLLRQYTRRQLTRSEDRLVALSGVAQYFKGIYWNDDCYIAGLWRSRLITEMVWLMTESTPREKWKDQRKKRHQLTFSWASVGGEVRNQAELFRNTNYLNCLADLDVVKYRTSPEALDATGGEGQPFNEDLFSLPATPAIEIRLTGFLRPMSIQRADVSTWRDKEPAPNERKWADSDLSVYSMGKDRPLEGQVRLDFEITSSELTALNDSGRLFLMPLVAFQGVATWILLLEHVETNDEKDMGRFRRIGAQEVRCDKNLLNCDAEYMSCESFTDLPCWRYDANSKHHTIFVI